MVSQYHSCLLHALWTDFDLASYTTGNSHINKHTRKEWDQHNKEGKEYTEA